MSRARKPGGMNPGLWVGGEGVPPAHDEDQIKIILKEENLQKGNLVIFYNKCLHPTIKTEDYKN
jgi:hypothetical protein